jgi:hypothetical protein
LREQERERTNKKVMRRALEDEEEVEEKEKDPQRQAPQRRE